MAAVIRGEDGVVRGRRTIPVHPAADQFTLRAGAEPPSPEPASQATAIDIDAFNRAVAELDALKQQLRLVEAERAELRERAAQAWEQARVEGRQEGLAQGRQQAEAAEAESLEALQRLFDSLAEERGEALRQAEEMALEVAFAATAKICGRTAVDTALLAGLVRQAVGQLRDRERLVVRLSPQDHARLDVRALQAGSDFDGANVDLVPDEQIGAGGCIVSGRTGSLDARLDVQLQELKRVLVELRAAATVKS